MSSLYFVKYLKKYDCPNVYNEYIKKVTASYGNMHHWLDYYGEDETVGLMLKPSAF